MSFSIKDCDNGSYEVKYKLDEPGEVLINIHFKNEFDELVPIRGNPFYAYYADDQKPDNNSLFGQAIRDYIKQRLSDVKDFIR